LRRLTDGGIVKKALFLVVFTLLVAGCGEKQPGNKEAYQGDTDACSPQFVRDYNAAIPLAKLSTKESDLAAAREKVQSFKSRYENVRCEASFQGERKTVDASKEAETTLSELDSKLKP